MRQAGTLPVKKDADRFAAYLLTQGITGKVEPAGEQWIVWIHDENALAKSREALTEYLREPENPRYQVEAEAERVRKEMARKAREAQKNVVDMRQEWSKPWRRRRVTVLLIAISIVVTLAEGHLVDLPVEELYFDMDKIMAGRIWRIFTPMFPHVGGIHLLFNMWWLYVLGSQIEWNIGSARYAALILASQLVTSFAQNYWVGPNFVGMSGVVYGLFGYAWVRGRLDPTSGLHLPQSTVFIMLAWLVLCMTAASLDVANAGHLGGLAAGMLIGAAHAYLPRFRRQNP